MEDLFTCDLPLPYSSSSSGAELELRPLLFLLGEEVGGSEPPVGLRSYGGRGKGSSDLSTTVVR